MPRLRPRCADRRSRRLSDLKDLFCVQTLAQLPGSLDRPRSRAFGPRAHCSPLPRTILPHRQSWRIIMHAAKNRIRLGLERLEAREVMDATLSVSGGALVIEGTSKADAFHVREIEVDGDAA